jgi:hypothetical protein
VTLNPWCWWGGWPRAEKQNKLSEQLKVKSYAGNVASQPCKPRQVQTDCTESIQNDEKTPENTPSQNQKTEKVDPSNLIEIIEKLKMEKEELEGGRFRSVWSAQR